jgi:hypothetical protein
MSHNTRRSTIGRRHTNPLTRTGGRGHSTKVSLVQTHRSWIASIGSKNLQCEALCAGSPIGSKHPLRDRSGTNFLVYFRPGTSYNRALNQPLTGGSSMAPLLATGSDEQIVAAWKDPILRSHSADDGTPSPVGCIEPRRDDLVAVMGYTSTNCSVASSTCRTVGGCCY